jgi:hypothetical protein
MGLLHSPQFSARCSESELPFLRARDCGTRALTALAQVVGPSYTISALDQLHTMRLRSPASRPRGAGAPSWSRHAGASRLVRAQAQKQPRSALKEALEELSGLGDTLGPIGLTYGGEVKVGALRSCVQGTMLAVSRQYHPQCKVHNVTRALPCLTVCALAQDTPVRGDRANSSTSASTSGGAMRTLADSAGVSLGPISLAYGDDFAEGSSSRVASAQEPSQRPPSISKLTTEEWRAQHEKDGYVDLWLEEEFNAGSRLIVRLACHLMPCCWCHAAWACQLLG